MGCAGPFISAVNSSFGVGTKSLWGLAAIFLTAGCATVPFEQTGALSSYENLVSADGVLTRARVSAMRSQVQDSVW